MRDKVLWTSEEAVAATGGRCLASWTATGVTLDSRQVAPGDLFVALKGEKDDGHAHVAEAIRRGATAALVERVPPGLETAPLLVVADAFEGLRALARAARERSKARIVAVTGSVGKTGTKEALRHALERQAFTYASAGNLNSEFGAPLALARLPREARYGVFELGMNKPGEIAANTRLVRPHVVIITTVEAVHLEFFPSVAAIAEAKAEIFEGLEPGGVAVLNRDNAHFELLAARARAAGAHVETFGASEACDARLDRVAVKPDCACVAATIHGEKIAYKIGMPGRHWAFNTLAVLVAVRALGGDLGLAALALPALRPAKGRGERRKLDLPGGSVLLVDESYNASPVATRAAIDSFAGAEVGPRGRRMVALGDMLELGPRAQEFHLALAQPLVDAKVDRVFTCGPMMGSLQQILPQRLRGGHAPDSASLSPLIAATIRPGDAVLIKGSLGSRMAAIVAAIEALAAPPSAAAD